MEKTPRVIKREYLDYIVGELKRCHGLRTVVKYELNPDNDYCIGVLRTESFLNSWGFGRGTVLLTANCDDDTPQFQVYDMRTQDILREVAPFFINEMRDVTGKQYIDVDPVSLIPYKD